MPYKRKDSKKHVGLWLEEEEIAALKAAATASGMTVADVIRKAFQKYEQENPVVSTGAKRSGTDRKSRSGGKSVGEQFPS